MVFWSNFKRVFSKPGNIIMMLVVPIVLNLVLITFMNSPVEHKILIVCQEETELTENIGNHFEKTFSVEYVESVESAENIVLNGYADYIVVLPEGTTQAMIQGESIVQTYCRQNDDSLKPIKVLVEGYFGALSQFGDASNGEENAFYNAVKHFDERKIDVEYKYCSHVSGTSVDNAVSSLGYVAVGMVYFITFATMLLFEDKKCGVFDRLSSSPMSRFSYLTQHLISYLLFAIVQIIIMIVLIPKLVDVEYGRGVLQILQIFGICTAFASTCIAIGITISSISQSVMMANGIISMINAPMLMLGGCFWPQSIMPEPLQRVGQIMPTTWFLKAASSVLRGESLSEYALWLALLIGLTLLLLVISFVFTTKGLGKYKSEGEKADD